MTSDEFPYVPIRVSIRDAVTETLALLDTGFTGDVVVPESARPSGVGEADFVRTYRVADDRIMHSDVFIGELEIPRLPSMSEVPIGVLGSRYIIGLGIIERFTVTLVHGEQVIVES